MLSKPLINELKQIWLEEYQVSLSEDEASNLGNSLIQYFDLLQKITNKKEQNDN
jgi:hypothetical protein